MIKKNLFETTNKLEINIYSKLCRNCGLLCNVNYILLFLYKITVKILLTSSIAAYVEKIIYIYRSSALSARAWCCMTLNRGKPKQCNYKIILDTNIDRRFITTVNSCLIRRVGKKRRGKCNLSTPSRGRHRSLLF